MATYKLIQDIEAEDHILGPLSLRQFIFALIAAFLYYICFLLFTKHASFLLILFVPPALFFTFFAFPFGRDQPTEVWALAKLRFWFKPRRRIWNQSGVRELVTITVPKKIEHVFSDGLSQTEVKSRLSALANTIDSRGWAIKNVNVGTYSQPGAGSDESPDRLINISNMPTEVPGYEITASDDILDETSNPIARQFDDMISTSTQNHRQHLVDELNGIRQEEAAKKPGTPADQWFMNRAAGMSQTPPPVQPTTIALPQPQTTSPPTTTPAVPVDEAALAAELKAQNNSQPDSYGNLRTVQPLSDNQQSTISNKSAGNGAVPSGTTAPDPAILSLASNNDLNVATLAREADKAKHGDEPHDEVVISLR
jgi:PrgI family protein